MLYNPPAFRHTETAEMFDFIDATPLATLITCGRNEPLITHLPVLLRRDQGEHGCIVGHLSRGNPQWRESNDAMDATAVFMGVDGYVSPSWYASKQEHGKVVPTWNYETVHATGTVRFIDDTDWLFELVSELTNRHERNIGENWQVTDAPDDFIARQLKGIVGVELEISKIEGKKKLSQNRPTEDQAGVLNGLVSRQDAGDLLERMRKEQD